MILFIYVYDIIWYIFCGLPKLCSSGQIDVNNLFIFMKGTKPPPSRNPLLECLKMRSTQLYRSFVSFLGFSFFSSHQWLFLVPLKGLYFSCQLGDGLCHRSHLLGEPETTIDHTSQYPFLHLLLLFRIKQPYHPWDERYIYLQIYHKNQPTKM